MKPPSPVRPDDAALRRGQLRTHRAGQAVADRGEAAVGDEVTAGAFGVEQQPAPVAGEAAVRHQDRIVRHDGVEFAHQAADIDRLLVRFEPVGRAFVPLAHARGHLGAPGLPLCARLAAVGQRCGEVLQREPRVGDQRDIGARGAADLLGEDIDMDQRLARRDQLEAPRRDFAELAGDHDQRVGGGDQIVGDARVAAEQPGRERMRAGDRALAGHRVRDRNAEAFREREQRIVGFRDVDAAADEQERALGFGDDLGGALQLSADRAACGAPAPSRSLHRPRNRRHRNHARRGRHPPARRARPAPAARRSPPRKRGAPIRGFAWYLRRGSAPSRRGLRISVCRASWVMFFQA